jgi:putative tryptophan/tyrosine transport system substrate-binding protein
VRPRLGVGSRAQSQSTGRGNITGMAGVTAELAGKSVEIIRELLPTAHRVVALANAPNPFSKSFLEYIRLAGVATSTTIDPNMIHSSEELEATFSQMDKERPDAVIVQPSLPSKLSAELALKFQGASRPFPKFESYQVASSSL